MSQYATQVLPTQSKGQFDQAVERAAEYLRQGEVVAVPSETVYGLAGNALSADAVRRIFQVKGRPQHNPLIVHVADWDMVERCADGWSDEANQLAKAFWPGPLTMVVRKSPAIPDVVTAGGETVALRWPSHPIMQAIIKATGFPIAAPSANRSNALSPTQSTHVMAQLGGRIPLVVDGGHTSVGIESTVVDLVGRPARVLRPGMIHQPELEAACEGLAWERARTDSSSDETVRSPGMLRHHYSPRAALKLAAWETQAEFDAAVDETRIPRSAISVIAYEHIPDGAGILRVSVIPNDADAYARALFSELFLCDQSGAELILVEMPPSGPEWLGIRDRLDRAAATEG